MQQLMALGSFNGISFRILRKGDFLNRNHSIKYVVFISFWSNLPIIKFPLPITHRSNPIERPSVIPHILNKINDKTKICQL
ncbi:hypothetical protein BGP_4357 [Beggiatoa sp. PS]|nr:hypothetical protein BGP_4357 [Beggiatoa sp. PS]